MGVLDGNGEKVDFDLGIFCHNRKKGIKPINNIYFLKIRNIPNIYIKIPFTKKSVAMLGFILPLPSCKLYLSQ